MRPVGDGRERVVVLSLPCQPDQEIGLKGRRECSGPVIHPRILWTAGATLSEDAFVRALMPQLPIGGNRAVLIELPALYFAVASTWLYCCVGRASYGNAIW